MRVIGRFGKTKKKTARFTTAVLRSAVGPLQFHTYTLCIIIYRIRIRIKHRLTHTHTRGNININKFGRVCVQRKDRRVRVPIVKKKTCMRYKKESR